MDDLYKMKATWGGRVSRSRVCSPSPLLVFHGQNKSLHYGTLLKIPPSYLLPAHTTISLLPSNKICGIQLLDRTQPALTATITLDLFQQ